MFCSWSVSLGSKDLFVLYWWQLTVLQDESDSASAERAAAGAEEGEDVKEEAEKETAEEEVPEPKKVSIISII